MLIMTPEIVKNNYSTSKEVGGGGATQKVNHSMVAFT